MFTKVPDTFVNTLTKVPHTFVNTRFAMKTLMAVTLTLGLGAGLFAQDAGKEKVESPTKKKAVTVDAPKTLIVERAVLETAKTSSPEKYDLSKTGIEWHRGIDSALNRGKPILLLQILGNYDDVYC